MAAHSASGKKTAQQSVQLNDPLLSSGMNDVVYKRLELLLIGFASVVITFLWVGVFSTVFQNRQIQFTFLGSGIVGESVRDAFAQAQGVARGIVQVADLATDTISYQFQAAYESSCLLQGTCDGLPLFVEAKAIGALTALNGLTAHSHRVVAVAQDVFTLRLLEAGRSVSLLFSPERAYADSVLGEKTVSTDVLLEKGFRSYYRSIDVITFGAVSVVNPELVNVE
ncbi:MAG: hypothetical protein Q8Q49_04005 [bacterium]|nr:hypothetical protein [bacterium]